MRLLLVPALALALLAGCIAPQDLPDQETESAAVAPPVDRIDGMTADVTQEDKSVPCGGGNSTIELPSACAERDLLVTGRIGVESLPVDLRGVNGPITIKAGDGDAWSLHAIYRVRAITPEDAKRDLDTAFNWTHEDGDQHVLRAGPTSMDALPLPSLTSSVVMARYEVVLPGWIVLDVRAATSNGPVTVEGLEATSVDLTTANGPVTFEGRAKDVSLATSNGPATLVLVPTGTGSVHVGTSNGPATVAVVEGPRHGYDVDASTSNGRVVIHLQDGEASKPSEDGPSSYGRESRATFRTHGFEDRAIQTTIQIETSNGPIVVEG